MTLQKKVSLSVRSWLEGQGKTARSLCEPLNIAPSTLSLKLSNERPWRISEIDALVEMGVISFDLATPSPENDGAATTAR